MKTNRSIFVTARAVLSALLFVTSIGMIVLSLNLAAGLDSALDTKSIRPTLLGPARSSAALTQAATWRGSISQTVHPDVPAAPPNTGAPIGFEIFEAPGTLVNVTSSSQGPSPDTVEYLAHDAGEPSIGVNWQSVQDTR